MNKKITLNTEEISKIFEEVNKQVYEFEVRYHVKPKFIKMGLFAYSYFRQFITNTWTYLGGESHATFMGLCICETPAIQDFTIEVF